MYLNVNDSKIPVNNMSRNTELTLHNVTKNISADKIKEFNRIYYGREDHCELQLQKTTQDAILDKNLDIAAYSFATQDGNTKRIVKLGLIQNTIVLPTDKPIQDQRKAIFEKVQSIIEIAVSEGVQVIGLQEAWSIPFFLCTREKEKWAGFVESAVDGPSIKFLSNLAKKYGIVIVSPILELDEDNVWWNTVVVIDENGSVMGKYRKNHLPSVGSFKETDYYSPGNLGHPVFNTKFGKIGINICYERHHALNWLMVGLNGAEIVFNPAATVEEFGESFWGIEARAAAVANSYFTCSINRVGTEVFTTDTDTGVKEIKRNYYGSSYVTAPDGCRTPCLSRQKDGLLIVEADLSLCRKMKDQWGFNMTARLDLYAEELKNYVKQ